MVSLPLAIPVSYEHGLQSDKVSNVDLRRRMMYPMAKGSNCVKMACFQSLLSWKIAMNMKLLSPTLKDHPEWVDPDAAVSPRASKSLHAVACMQFGASIQDALVTTSSTSSDGRVAGHKIWGSVLDTSSTTLCIVMPAVAPYFKDIV
eukprot:4269822-Ditylum_brightwellii.AAC.1